MPRSVHLCLYFPIISIEFSRHGPCWLCAIRGAGFSHTPREVLATSRDDSDDCVSWWCHLNAYESNGDGGDLSVVRKCGPSRWWKIGCAVWAIRSICSEFEGILCRAAQPRTWTLAWWDWQCALTLARVQRTTLRAPLPSLLSSFIPQTWLLFD